MLFSAASAEALRGVSPLLDMWRPTSPQAGQCAKIHYDEDLADVSTDSSPGSRFTVDVLRAIR